MIEKLIYAMMARECTLSPEDSLEKIWRKVQQDLTGFGIATSSVNPQLVANFEQCFLPRLIPNFLYWQQQLKRQHVFYFLKTRSNKYAEVLKTLEKDFPLFSNYVCYGETDVLLQIIAEQDQIGGVRTFLEDKGLLEIELKVEHIPYAYGYRFTSKSKFEKSDLSLEDIDKILTKPATDIDPTIKRQLKESNIILGQAYQEDTHQTGRIRAFVGINNALTEMAHADFIDKLLEIIKRNYRLQHIEVQYPPVIVYRCGTHYPYFLEMIFDDQAQLDNVTDNIQELAYRHRYIDNIVTIIVAKSFIVPPQAVAQADAPGIYNITSRITNNLLTPTLAEMRNTLSPRLESSLAIASDKSLYDTLSLYSEIALAASYTTAVNWNLSKESLEDFLEGTLTQNPQRIESAGMRLVKEVEAKHQEFFKVLLNLFFNGDATRFHHEVGVDDDRWRKWGLSKFATHVYPRWNKHRYGATISIPDDIIHRMNSIGYLRNRLAHTTDTENKQLEKEQQILDLILSLRNAFHDAYYIMNWLDETHALIGNEKIFSLIKRVVTSEASNQDRQIYASIREISIIINNLEINQERILEIVENRETDARWAKLEKQLYELKSGINDNLEGTLMLVEELIIPEIIADQRGLGEQLQNLLRRTARNLPENLLAEILILITMRMTGLEN